MSASQQFFYPRLLLARELRQISASELAAGVGVTPATISLYESGRCAPTDEHLVTLARALRVPLRFFGLPLEIEPVDSALIHYRSRSRIATGTRRYVEALGYLFRLLMDRVVRLIPLRTPTVPKLDPHDGGVELAARHCRRLWGLGDGPLPNLLSLMEANGIWVHVLPPHVSEKIDAFSYWHAGTPNVFLNRAKLDSCRWRYDAGHELGHLVMHDRADGEGSLETEANQFAAAFLLPRDPWMQESPCSTSPWDYVPLKSRWKVSVKAMMYRSHSLGLLSEREFKSAMVRYSMLDWRIKGEPLANAAENERPTVLSILVGRLRAMGTNLDELAGEVGISSDLVQEMMGIETSPNGFSSSPSGGVEREVVSIAAYRARRGK